ncbi:MAG TPA: FAD-binding oxidoreductase, partial [Woeseiaceae bacterium]|nr:FAD-binding oxidoreductase [Woeseiaceae bacterium]
LRLCHAAGQSVVVQGGLTGIVDGARSTANDVVISLERMNRIESVDALDGVAVVQSGAILQNVQEALERQGFLFPLDLGARGSCTIGGTVATNAGGMNVLRYGMMRNLVLGLEAVLADGTIVSSMNRLLKNNAGYDLKQLFIGTEGTLGIVTRAVLRLRPALRSRNTAFVAVDDYANVPRLLKSLGSSLGGSLTAFEVLWEDFYNTVVVERDRHAPPVEAGHPWYVLIEARGGQQEEDAERFQVALEEVLEAGLIVDAAFASGAKQREAMWAIRDDIDGLAEILDPVMAFDVSLPIAHTADYVAAVKKRLNERWPDTFRGTSFGHLGDNNLHFLLTVGSRDHDEQREVMEIIYDELKTYRGSISAEHGIGLEKRAYLGVTRNETEVALMRSLKKALDPKGLLNPGRIF